VYKNEQVSAAVESDEVPSLHLSGILRPPLVCPSNCHNIVMKLASPACEHVRGIPTSEVNFYLLTTQNNRHFTAPPLSKCPGYEQIMNGINQWGSYFVNARSLSFKLLSKIIWLIKIKCFQQSRFLNRWSWFYTWLIYFSCTKHPHNEVLCINTSVQFW
jgi:hypothetical protein